MKNQKMVTIAGWIASAMSFLMFFSFFDQIKLNLDGPKGSVLLPIASCLNCMFWVIYGVVKENKDWPLISCNIFGSFVSLITIITALI